MSDNFRKGFQATLGVMFAFLVVTLIMALLRKL